MNVDHNLAQAPLRSLPLLGDNLAVKQVTIRARLSRIFRFVVVDCIYVSIDFKRIVFFAQVPHKLTNEALGPLRCNSLLVLSLRCCEGCLCGTKFRAMGFSFRLEGLCGTELKASVISFRLGRLVRNERACRDHAHLLLRSSVIV